jgi:hypothetical protein
MSVYSPVYHAMVSSPAGPVPVTAAADKPAAQDEGFFHHLLDVINPLQHLPVIGTIYRAITGDHIGTIEKVAGDALYGGLWGAVASIADVAFEAVTGKSMEDTALAWIKGDGKPDVAANKVAAPAIAMNGALPSSDLPALPSAVAANMPDGAMALASALSAKGVDSETAGRALYAYRRSMAMFAPQPVFASIN